MAQANVALLSAGRFERAISALDLVHAQDPDRHASGEPKELAYARHMSEWLAKLAPGASEELRLAARCQHIRRWAIARSAYPAGKVGYLRWRKEQALAHAALAADILGRAGYDDATMRRVQSLIKKEGIKHDPEAQLLEDAACLVFLEFEFEPFAAKHPEDKVIDILRKTWPKMSSQGQKSALGLKLPAPLRALVEKALSK